jgi:threonine/homoserine/homoserine lactone efflux protein
VPELWTLGGIEIMHDTFRMFVGVVYIIWAFIAFSEFMNREKPHARWAKACLLISAVTAILAAVAIGLVVNRRADVYMSQALLRQLRTDFEGVTIGLLIALLLSGQLSKKKPPEQ